MRGQGGACIVSAVGTCEVSTAGYLPLEIAAASATDGEEVVFLSAEKEKEEIKLKNLQKF